MEGSAQELNKEYQPLERKEFPPYIKERYELMKQIDSGEYPLDEPIPDYARRYLIFRLKDNIHQRHRKTSSIKQSTFLPLLISLLKDEDPFVRKATAEALGNIGQPAAIEPLIPLLKDEDPFVRKAASQALLEIKKNIFSKEQLIYNLIHTQESLLANPFAKELIDKNPEFPLLPLINLVKDLMKKYPELVGLSVLGSLSKGYWIPGRDIDWGLIFDSQCPSKTQEEIIREFKDRVNKLGFFLCENHSLTASSEYRNIDPSNLEIVFNGLFIGDRKRLYQIQKQILEQVDEKKWQQIQRVWLNNLSNYSKMADRFGLTKEQIEEIIASRMLLWSLPDLNTMKLMFGISSNS